MTYKQWFEDFSAKHKDIVDKLLLENYSKEQIIDYFDYENMVINEPYFCPLFKENKKCHNTEDLNCYLCGCPNFRLYDTKSSCSVNSSNGSTIQGKDGFIHQDCSNCTIPHNKTFVKEHFNFKWKIIMSEVITIN
jgi:Zn-finger protein